MEFMVVNNMTWGQTRLHNESAVLTSSRQSITELSFLSYDARPRRVRNESAVLNSSRQSITEPSFLSCNRRQRRVGSFEFESAVRHITFIFIVRCVPQPFHHESAVLISSRHYIADLSFSRTMRAVAGPQRAGSFKFKRAVHHDDVKTGSVILGLARNFIIRDGAKTRKNIIFLIWAAPLTHPAEHF